MREGADCPRFGKLIGGCRFEARYDTRTARMPAPHELEPLLLNDRLQAVQAMGNATYVRDVCIRCGRTVERNV